MEHEKNTPLSLPHFKKTFMSYMGWPPKYVYNLDGILGRNQKVSSWYISEQIIPFSDILRIENRYDGTVYYGEPDPKRKEVPHCH